MERSEADVGTRAYLMATQTDILMCIIIPLIIILRLMRISTSFV